MRRKITTREAIDLVAFRGFGADQAYQMIEQSVSPSPGGATYPPESPSPAEAYGSPSPSASPCEDGGSPSPEDSPSPCEGDDSPSPEDSPSPGSPSPEESPSPVLSVKAEQRRNPYRW